MQTALHVLGAQPAALGAGTCKVGHHEGPAHTCMHVSHTCSLENTPKTPAPAGGRQGRQRGQPVHHAVLVLQHP